MNVQKNVRKKSILGKIFLAIFILFAIFTAYIFYKIYTAPESEKDGGIFTQIKQLIMSSDKKLEGESQDRVNILVMGVGGGTHEGPYLTDTLIVVSIQPSTKRVGMLSIPRDLYVPIPGFGEGKINTAYALVRAKNPDQAAQTTKTIIENIFKIPIHYYARVDFEGFVKIIDDLGGITINVENTLDDPYFPIEDGERQGNGALEHLVISRGIRYMNGETALKYIRSRKARGVEGSDFARSKRQQKVMLAVKEKLLSPGTFLNFNGLSRIIQSLNAHIDTNLKIWEILRLHELTNNIPSLNINHVILDDGPKSPLYASTSTDAYFLKTKSDNWSDLQNIAHNIFDQNIASNIAYEPVEGVEKKAKALETQKKENAIEIDNGTNILGLAKKTSSYLTVQGYNVIDVGNTPIRTYKKNIIYNLKPEQAKAKKEIIKDLEEIFDAVVFENGPPQDIILTGNKKIRYPINAKSDILIILGESWRKKFIQFKSNIK